MECTSSFPALRQLDEKERDAQPPAQMETESEPETTEVAAPTQCEDPVLETTAAIDVPVKELDEPEVEPEEIEGPSAESVAEVVAESEVIGEMGSPFEPAPLPPSPDSANQASPLVEGKKGFPIIDEEALRELDELLSNLNVEEHESHE
jgi:hypothetical protein